MTDKECPLCAEPTFLENSVGRSRIIIPSSPKAESHYLWLPHAHLSQEDMVLEKLSGDKDPYFDEMMSEIMAFGKHFMPDGYQVALNFGKYCSVPNHAHAHVLYHPGEHKPGNQGGICERCRKFPRNAYVDE